MCVKVQDTTVLSSPGCLLYSWTVASTASDYTLLLLPHAVVPGEAAVELGESDPLERAS